MTSKMPEEVLGYNEYLPCPLCETKALPISHDRDTWMEVICQNPLCQCRIAASSILDAMRIWNSRTSIMTAKVQELQDELIPLRQHHYYDQIEITELRAKLEAAEKSIQEFRAQAITDFGQIQSALEERDKTREAAENMAKALEHYMMFENIDGENSNEKFDRIASVFKKQTGFLRPGKDCVIHSPESRQMEWDAWMNEKTERAKQALAKFKENK